MNTLPKLAFVILISFAYLRSLAAETNGLYYIASGERADIEVYKAVVFSLDNANSSFGICLTINTRWVNPKILELTKPVELRIDGDKFSCSGQGYSSPRASLGTNYTIFFRIGSQDNALTACKLFSAEYRLRSPPGYRFQAQFAPSKISFTTNQPIIVSFKIKNLDNRTMVFEEFRRNPENRNDQYGFVAMHYDHPVPDVEASDAYSPGGSSNISTRTSIKPGEIFEDKIDMKNWFAFDKPGSYIIHGFYRLNFYSLPNDDYDFFISNGIWDDYASADFSIVIK